jgi:hypothetical protein
MGLSGADVGARTRRALALGAIGLLAGACGSSDKASSSSSATTPAQPLTTSAQPLTTTAPRGTTSAPPVTTSARGSTGRTLSPAQRARLQARLFARGSLIAKTFGSRATPAQLASVSKSIEPYLAAVAAHEYARACSLLYHGGQNIGLPGMTCEQNLTRRLGEPTPYLKFGQLAVKDARLEEPEAKGYALIGPRSSSKPQGFIAMRREGGVWKPVGFIVFPFHAKPPAGG